MKDEDLIAKWCNSCNNKDGKYECYGDEELATCFWALNVTDNMERFDWDNNFDVARNRIENKLGEHGLLGPDKYKEFVEDIYGKDPKLSELAVETNWTSISKEEILDNAIEFVSERMKEQYEGQEEFEDMEEILGKIYNADKLTKSEKVLLFDKIIHLEHVTGSLFDINIEDLRKEFEADLK